jgi:hypothetical protein
MVHVVFAEVILRKVGDIGLLDMRNVRHLHHPNIHDEGLFKIEIEG